MGIFYPEGTLFSVVDMLTSSDQNHMVPRFSANFI